MLNTLGLCSNQLGFEGGEALADALCKNTILTSLDVSLNCLENDVGRALVKSLHVNTTLILQFNDNLFDSEVDQELKELILKRGGLGSGDNIDEFDELDHNYSGF
ncbi:hypothetical protein C2G38_2050690 [Gigaspora rosea]|uniref:RNI-like protein n=1 Tax=Gigaspora rosea TaxID=44941 RepID=A0A397TYY3_9GLOM|nr:hypothetical protein C2G38_2050690 [Gigaspora rosea]